MVVSLKLIGHDRIYELTHIVKEAFINAVISDENPDVFVISSKDENTIKTIIKGKDALSEASFSFNEEICPVTKEGHAVGISFLKAYKSFSDTSVPWGALIGIRPSKIISNFRAAGYPLEETVKILTDDYMIHKDKIDLMIKTDECEARLLDSLNRKSFSVYIGIPFCPTRCSYCSFISRTYKDEKILSLYIDALIKELSLLRHTDNLHFNTIYIGGGTPTSLPPHLLERLMNAINDNLNIKEGTEFTVEAGRPDTVTKEKLEIIKAAGASRISINPQTLNDKTLKLIGRNHNEKQFFEAYDIAKKVGFDVINTDLILGLPKETKDDFLYTIDNILKLNPENITLHTLAIKRAADLGGDELTKNPAREMHEIAAERLKGYIPYYLYRQKNTVDNLENTGYSHPGKECIYNMCMMGDMETVLSFGGGAVTKLVEDKDIIRLRNPKDADLYIKTIDDVIGKKLSEIINYNNSRNSL